MLIMVPLPLLEYYLDMDSAMSLSYVITRACPIDIPQLKTNKVEWFPQWFLQSRCYSYTYFDWGGPQSCLDLQQTNDYANLQNDAFVSWDLHTETSLKQPV